MFEAAVQNVTCRLPPLTLFQEVRETDRPMLQEGIVRPGHWTTLALIAGPPSEPELLVAISRPSSDLELTVGLLAIERAVLFGGLLLGASLLGLWLVYRAQRVIDVAFEAQSQIRSRMRQMLSKSARDSALRGQPTATRHLAVTMFADLRNFSSYADSADVEETARLVGTS